ncbi:hypothetical protein HL658_02770 [Azospirillum sp. RWY-5-1]|uniref:Uncharacterized protein n=1 Tax=Azospirillum oleiclasticum TaxID=2735135 RepID=A0ABX2T7G9_9PROT|nr:hypothetical protein [Azospirillum oleiclasticum]NYZ11459.1 hypothetical protein [Azospirillum oleiclasticum]NYZ18620.1 hypothetical protein [Azospirillum oleiclasticum]
MATPFTAFDGATPVGVDILTERARRAAAERRWQHPAAMPWRADPAPSACRGALQDGAQLTRFADMHAARSP